MYSLAALHLLMWVPHVVCKSFWSLYPLKLLHWLTWNIDWHSDQRNACCCTAVDACASNICICLFHLCAQARTWLCWVHFSANQKGCERATYLFASGTPPALCSLCKLSTTDLTFINLWTIGDDCWYSVDTYGQVICQYTRTLWNFLWNLPVLTRVSSYLYKVHKP